MRIIALGGAGGMGRRALSVLSGELIVDEVVVADLDGAAAAGVAAELRRLGQPASSRSIDVTDPEALRAFLADADLLMNSVGPYFRFGVPILEAAIAAGIDYIDICDDAQPTADMLALDERARAAGITAVIGAGASPGFMNVLARQAAHGLDEVRDVTVGWTLNSAVHGWDMMKESDTGGSAAAIHLLEEFVGDVPVRRGGALVTRRTREAIRIDIPGLGTGTGYVVGHPEPVTLPLTLGATGESVSVCMLTSGRAAALHETAARVESGELTLEQALEVLRDALGEPISAEELAGYPSGGDLPIYFVAVTGMKHGESVTQFAGCLRKPELMREGTGIPYGVAVAFAASHDLPKGVLPLDAVIDPDPYFARVAAGWNVPRGELTFTGSAPLADLIRSTP